MAGVNPKLSAIQGIFSAANIERANILKLISGLSPDGREYQELKQSLDRVTGFVNGLSQKANSLLSQKVKTVSPEKQKKRDDPALLRKAHVPNMLAALKSFSVVQPNLA